MKILDLFCGAGGAAMGMHQAYPEAEITGIDHKPQPEYPFHFIKMDIADLDAEFCNGFDFIWASPPCQRYSVMTPHNEKNNHACFIVATRTLLSNSGKPGVIENVPPTPIREDLMLCGEMFGLRVIRHRKFECFYFASRQPKHVQHKGMAERQWRQKGKPGGRGGLYYQTVTGHSGVGKNIVGQWQEAMGIQHITKKSDIALAIPPAYSMYIFKEFLANRPKQLTFF